MAPVKSTPTAATRGNGGEVWVVAEENAAFTAAASISARGGALSGDGGFVEFSGHQAVSVNGWVDVNSVNGKAGLWYIDPTDISITNTDSNGTFSGGTPWNWTFFGSPATSQINVVSIRNSLSTGDVTINTASGAASTGNITWNGTMNYNGLGTVRTLTLIADGTVDFQTGSFLDANTATAADGLNLNVTAGSGITVASGVGIDVGPGKINFTATTGNATITGLSSNANATDAVRVTASAGSIVDGGNSFWDATALVGTGGVILSGRDGINVGTNANTLDLLSTNGNISVVNLPAVNVARISAQTSSYLAASGNIRTENTTVFGGSNLQFLSTGNIILPSNGITVSANLTLQANDIVDQNNARALTITAGHLIMSSAAAGGDSIFNTTLGQLSVTNSSSNTLTFNETNAVTTTSINPQSGTTVINSGAGFDLTISSAIELDGKNGTLTLNAGKDLIVNNTITDTLGGVNNNTPLNLLATNNVTFGASGAANAGAGNVTVTASNGNVVLGNIAGASMTVSATGSISDANGASANLTGTSATLSAGTSIGTSSDRLDATLGSLTLTASNGSAYLTNSQALSLTSANIQGDLDITLPTAGDLTLVQASPTITGTANFNVANGQIIIPNAGWSIAGGLTFSATNLLDTDTNITLGGGAASITLSNAAADRSWSTSLSSLALNLTGAGNFTLTDTNGLTLTSATTGANASFTTTNANLTLSADPSIGGNLSLITSGSGNVILPTTGITESGNLTITADDLLDTDRTVTLGAATATITLRNAASAMVWNSSFSDLVLSLTGGGDLALTDTNALTLTSASTSGNASFTTTNADLTLSADPAVTGNLSLITTGTGNVIIPTTGISQPAGIIISANDILDIDRSLTLSATNASITLRDNSAVHSIVSSFSALSLALTGAAAFNLTDADALTLSAASSGGDVNLTATAADLTLSADTSVSGTLNLTTTGTGNLVVPVAGFTQSAGLIISANDLLDTDRTLTLGASSANITLRSAASAMAWNTSFSDLILSLTGGGDFVLTDTNGLTLTSASTSGNASFTATNADLTLSSDPAVSGNLSLITTGTGNVIIPVAGISQPAGLTISANDILDTDRSLTLSATNASITLRDNSAVHSITSSFSALSLALTGAAAFNLTDSNALTLSSATSGGDVNLTATSADLTLSANATVSGTLNLTTTGTGNVVIPTSGFVQSAGLTINANDLIDTDRTVTLGATSADITLRNAASSMAYTTTFTNLILSLTGGGDFVLTDNNALTLTSASTSGNASFTTSNADLTLSADPAVIGNLSLITTGSGNVIIPTTGISQPAGLTISANDILDTDRSLTLSATNASITLRDNSAVHSIASSFSALTLALTGAATFNLTDTDALTLSSASSGGDVNLTATSADLTLSADTSVSGTLNLTTTGTGNLVVPVAGFTQSAGLIISANDLLDTDRSLTLGATSANITLRSAASAMAWNTSFSDLILSLTGGGDFVLTDTNGLTLTSASTSGNASFTTTNADLTLSSDPVVSGNLSLITTGTGNVIIPTTGISQPAGLTISANDILDTDRSLTLSATNASITLRDNSAVHSITSSFSALSLALTGAAAFNLTDADALTLSAASSGGDVNLTATAADLTLSADTSVSGNLNLTTTGTGNLVVPVAGFTQSAGLIISANDLLDTDRTLTLGASSANITLRSAASAMAWNTSFSDLILSLTGGGDFVLTDTNGLTLTSASTSGNASFTATNADLTLSSDPAVSGNLSLITTGTGNVIIPVAGISQPAGLTISANDILDTDRSLALSATNASITLRDNSAVHSITSSFSALSLALTGAAAFNLTDSNALTLSSATSGGDVNLTATGADLTLSANTTVSGTLNLTTTGTGNVVIPASGFVQSAGLTINANDLIDTDRTVTLGATNADITLRNAASSMAYTSSFNNLILALTGGGDFVLTDNNALTLTSASTSGNASFTSTNADLTLSADPAVTGNLSLITTGTGNVIIPTTGISQPAGLTISANDILDTDRSLTLSATNASITLRDNSAVHSIASSFSALTLALTGAAAFNLTDADALTLSSASSGGDVNLTATSADLTVSADTSVSGTLNLTTTGTGNVVIPTTGFTQSAGLTINASDLTDTDRTIIVGATNADITLRNAASSMAYTSSFSNLILSLTGGGDFALTDTNALTLTSASTSGNASFTTSNADLTLSADPAVTGNLSLITTGSGNVIIPTTGISQPAGLTISANDILDTDRSLTLSATNASITLRDNSAVHSIASSFSALSLALTGTATFNLTDSNALTLSSASSGGDVNLTATAADLTLNANTTISGTLNLTATTTGNVVIPVAGFSQSAGLTINANDLIDTDRTLTLSATNADITLRNASSAMVWNSSFTNLILSLAGAGDFALTDNNGLTVTSASTSGNASFATTNADLTLSSDPAVAGDLSLITTGTGNVIIPTSGISQPAGLTINANDVLDTDRTLTLVATNAAITLRDNSAVHSITSSFSSLNLALTGAATFNLTDSNELTLGSASSGGDVNLTATAADLTLSANTTVSGTLNLTTTGTGNVVIPVAGFTQSAGLTINANDLADTDRTLTLGASNVDITLRNAASSMVYNTTFTNLILSLTGGGDFALTDTNALTLASASTSGNASFTTTNGDLTLFADPAVTGNLSLSTTGTGNVIIPTGGISQPAGLTISANDVLDTDRTFTLAATNAAITLRDNSAVHSINSSFNALSLALTGAATFNLTDTDAITLSSASSGGDVNIAATAADLTVSADTAVSGTVNLTATGAGNVVIPTTGFTQSAGLTINANDLIDTDRILTLGATNADIILRNAASAMSWATSFNNLILALTGGGDLALTDSNALTLTSATTSGNASFTTTNADLTLSADPAVTGNLSLITTGTGNVVIPVGGISQPAGLTISANDLLDADRTLTLAATNAAITLRDNSALHAISSNFSALSLALTGAATFNLTDNDALTLSSASSGGDVNLSATAADLTLGSNATVSGTLNLTTTGTGNVVIPTSGFVQSAGLTINANDLIDTDRTVTLGATSADITLRNAANSMAYITSFSNLILALTGGGDFVLTDSNALTLTSASTSGNASFTSTNADLTLSADPVVTGNLSLITTGTGNVIIPTTGISQPAGLTISANDILDTDSSLTLSATNASITLRDNSAVHSIASSFSALTLALTGAAAFNLTDADALTLSAVSSGGDVNLTATAADLTLSADTSVSGTLNLTTTGTGNLVVPVAGFTQSAGLIISANDLLDTDRTLTLGASTANITLRSAASAMAWNTSFADLILSLTGGGDVVLTDTNGLTLTSVSTSGNASFTTTNADLTLSSDPAVTGNLSLNTTGAGNVIIPVAGISQPAALTINANDVLDADRDLTLAAGLANITLRDASAARTWNTSFSDLNLALTGAGDFTLTDTDGLNLNSATSGGNVNLTTSNADLTLGANTSVAGTLNLTTTGTGNLIVPVAGFTQSSALNINANDLLDADRDLTLAATNANISLRNAAAARSWATNFNNLILSLTGSGDFALTDSNALTLNSATTGGSASFTTTNADLTLSSDPAVAGNLSLITTGTGNVIIPVAGISQPAGLTISANDLLDTDRDLTLAAGAANITLRNAASARNWTTSFNDLIMSLTGTGAFTLTDANGLNLTSATTGGDASFTTTNADLTLASGPAVSGNLSLNTTGTGNVIIPLAGISTPGALSINANDLLDTDRDINLTATSATISLRNASSARNWTTSFNDLVLALTGTGDFALTDSNALTLTSATTGGNASFTTTNADLILSSDPAIAGNLSLNTTGTGNVVIPVAGISQSAGLTINANDVLDTDRDLTLAAGLANITLRDASAARTWNASFSDLNLTLTGAGDFTLTDTDGLNLNSATSGGDVSLTTNNADLSIGSSLAVAGNLSLFTTGAGNVYVPTAGINQPGALIINANDLLDTDSDVNLAANSASITLRNAAAPRNWNTSFNDLTLSLTGGGDFALTDNNALNITAATTGGNTSFTTTNGDLTLASDPNAGGNLSLDTLGSGRIILPVAGISEAGNLTINADDVLDTDTNVSLAATDADINLRAATGSRTWNTDFDRLSLSISGGDDFNLINTGDLTIAAFNSDGSTGFNTLGDLNLSAATAFGHDLNLVANGGVVILPATGIAIAGDLIIDSDDLMDADRDVQLSAASADITLRNASQARSWTTDFGSLTLSLNGGGDLSLVDTNGLTLNAITTGGNAGFTASNNNLIVTANPQVGGNLSLAATGAGAVVVPTAGINQTGNLTISARDLIDNDNDIILAADNASINLRNAQGLRNWNTTINSLDLTLVGAADLTLTNSQALTLAALNSDGSAGFTATNAALTLATNPNISGNLSLLTTGNGNVILPAGGLNLPALLTINSQDLLDTNRDISLAASDATITLRDASGPRNWQTNFDQLNLSLNGNGDFNLIDADALTLAALTSGGNTSITATNGDLTLVSTPSVNGLLSLNGTGSGNLVLPTGGINHGNGLSINANDILDSQNSVNASRDLSLTATNADITLRGAMDARTWATDFSQLDLALSGGGDFVLTDANGLNLNSVVSAGNTHFTATGANLVVLNNPQVAGNLGLSATGAGSVVIPAAGINHGGALTINAADLQDTDLNLILAASNGQITLRNAVAPRSWATDFAHLALNLTGGGDLSVTNGNELSLDAAQTAANLSVTTTNADLTLPANTQVTGNLNLTATGAGNVIVPNSGFTQAAGISINAIDVLDADRAINLTATDAVINLRGAISPSAWQTQLNNLSLALNGGGDFALINNQQLTLASVQSPGNVSITTAGDLTLAGNPAVAGRLALNTSGAGNLIMPQTGISQLGALSINANDILDADGDISLAATLASINLRSVNTARTWATSFADLALTLSGTGAINLTDSDALNITGLTSQGDVSLATTNADLTLGTDTAVNGTLNLNATGNGAIILPATGFSQTGALSINASDLLDGDRNIRLAATAADITLRNAAASRTWQSDLTSLNLSISGGGDFALTDVDGLTLNTISSGGNAAFTTTQGDLILAQNPQVQGNLYLAATGSGNLIIPAAGISHAGSLIIDASDVLDTDRDISLAASDADINLRALTNSRVWNSQLNAVSVHLSGGGALTLNNTGAITLNAAASLGELSINTNNANIRLAADSQIAGGLNLNAAGMGAVVLPEQGFNQSGALAIKAFDLLDSDHAIRLGAQAADITLGSAAARSWNTNLASLSLNLTGLAPLSLTNAQSLTLNTVSTQGDASFTSLGDLTLGADPAVAGTLSLIGSGALVLPSTGLTQPGLVVIDAQDLRDDDRTVNLAAPRAQITLRNPAGALSLNTQLAGLDLTSGGPFAISLSDADDLSLGVISSLGDLAISSVGNLDVTAASLAIEGKLSLVASDQVQLSALGLGLINPDALLSPVGQMAPGAGTGGDLIIRAAGIEVAGGGPVRLAARSADIALSGSQPLSLAGQLDELALSTQTEATVSISNDRDLNLLSLASPQASSLNFAINGALRIPASGLTGSGLLAINAFDLFDDDRTLSLAAEQLQVGLNAASGQNLWNLAVDELDIALTGSADLTLTDSQGLMLRDLNNDGKSLALSDGNLALRLASGDLSIRASLIAEDASPDAQAAGEIDLAVAAGSIESQGALSITARSARAQPAGSFSLRMVLGDRSGADRSIRLGAGAQVTAIGGDILLDTRPQGTAAGARRTFEQEAASGALPGAQVSAYSNQSDPATGRVTLNGAPIAASQQQRIGSNRWLAIVADGPTPITSAPDQTEDLSQAVRPLEQPRLSGLTVDEQFGKVFGDCDEFDPKTRHRCKVNSALKAFLGHWLVGGELPSKREAD